MNFPHNRLYLVRHGQTDSNRDKIIQGSRDIPLNQEGLEQARAMSPFIQELPLDRVYCSDMVRAQKTAEILLQGSSLEIKTLSGLREQDYGELEGVKFTDLVKQDASISKEYYRDPSSVEMPGGEQFGDFKNRVVAAWEDHIREKDFGHNILIVAHGGSLRILMAHLLDIPAHKMFFRITLDNVSVTRIDDFGPKFRNLQYSNHVPR